MNHQLLKHSHLKYLNNIFLCCIVHEVLNRGTLFFQGNLAYLKANNFYLYFYKAFTLILIKYYSLINYYYFKYNLIHFFIILFQNQLNIYIINQNIIILLLFLFQMLLIYFMVLYLSDSFLLNSYIIIFLLFYIFNYII